MGVTGAVPAAIPDDSARIEALKVEADHFYTSEFHSEQRASWLLTIAFGMLAVVLNAFTLVGDRKLNARAQPALTVCVVFLCGAILSALWAIWPLQGGRGRLSLPWDMTRSKSLPGDSGVTWWEKHYEGHRRRAEIKVVRVVWTLICLLLGVAAGIAAVLANSGMV